ncbi:MAG: hypothetical protein FWG02_04260 [Holophagaceae bacterium]|nr:hypothetical protein [Holophagaceae bacterium]
MLRRNIVWIAVPIVLSAGVIWLSAQDNKAQSDGVKIGEMAQKLQERERNVTLKETELAQLQQRLTTLQATLNQEKEQVLAREKAITDEKAKISEERSKIKDEYAKFEVEKSKELERLKELEKTIELERSRKLIIDDVTVQLVRTYEAMDPANASKALQELAGVDFDVAVGLLVAMQPKKAAKILDELTPLDTKLTGKLSEQVGIRHKEVTKK